MRQSLQSDPANTSNHTAEDHETHTTDEHQLITDPLVKTGDNPLKVKIWTERIKMDAAYIWQSEDQLKYFNPLEMKKLQRSFARSTLSWVVEELSSPNGLSDEKLRRVYDLYLLQFQEIASVMTEKKKAEKVRDAIQKYEHSFRSGVNADANDFCAFSSLLAEISSLDYGQDVVFHFLCQRPDILQSR